MSLLQIRNILKQNRLKIMRKNLHEIQKIINNTQKRGQQFQILKKIFIEITTQNPTIPDIEILSSNIQDLDSQKKEITKFIYSIPKLQKKRIKHKIQKIRKIRFLKIATLDILSCYTGFLCIIASICTITGWIPNILPYEPLITAGAWLLLAALLELTRKNPKRIRTLFQKIRDAKTPNQPSIP